MELLMTPLRTSHPWEQEGRAKRTDQSDLEIDGSTLVPIGHRQEYIWMIATRRVYSIANGPLSACISFFSLLCFPLKILVDVESNARCMYSITWFSFFFPFAFFSRFSRKREIWNVNENFFCKFVFTHLG